MTRETHEEIRLLEASLRGDTTAFETIVRAYQSLVCGITFSALGDVAESEDLAQQTFINAWKDLAQLRDLDKFKHWLCSIARNAVRNTLRDRKRDPIRKAVPIDGVEPADAAASEADDSAAAAERQAVVRQALQQIPLKYREPLVLFYRQDKSVRELAAQLDLSENAVRQRLSRGRKLLKERVAAMVETTISRTAPGKAFTAGVVAAIGTLAVTSGRGASASAVQDFVPSESLTSAAPAAAAGTTTVFGAAAVKIIAAALIAAAGVSAVMLYRSVNRQEPAPAAPQASVTPAIFIPEEATTPRATIRPSAPIKAVETDSGAPAAGPSPQPQGPEPVAAGNEAPEVHVLNQPQSEFAPQGVLSGLITDAQTGKPVVDARVEITKSRRFEAVTDANGFYHIDEIDDEGSYKIRLHSREYLWVDNWNEEPSIVLKKDAKAVKHFGLERGCQVQVEVADPNGRPVKDTYLYVTWMGERYGRQTERQSGRAITTGADGRRIMGAFRPSATAYLVTAMHRDYAPAKCVVQLTDPNVVAPARVVMQKGTTVEGYAAYADGQPAADLKITAQPKWWNITTCTPLCTVDAAGAFTLTHIAPDDYIIMVHIPNPGGGSLSSSVLETVLPLQEGLLMLTIPGDSPAGLTLISGTIDFINGPPSGNVTVSAYSTKTGPKQGRVTGDAFVVDRLKPGTYRLTFSGENIESKTLTDIAGSTQGMKVELKCLRPGGKPRLQGVVVNAATGRAVPHFKARVRILKSLTGSYTPAAMSWHELTDPEGKFDIESPGPGTAQVQIAAEGLAWTWSDPVDGANPQPIIVALAPGGVIKGRVVDGSGTPVNGAKIIPLSKAGGNLWFDYDRFTSAAGAVESTGGRFVLGDLATRSETVKVTHPNYSPAVYENIRVDSAETAEDVELVLTPGGTVHGHVHDEQGKPQANVLIVVQDAAGYRGSSDTGRIASAVTDKNGYYRIEHLPEQICYVQRSEYYRGAGVVCRTVDPVDGEETTLDFGGPTVLSGRFLVDGHPLAATELMLGDPYNSSALAFVSRVTGDGQGCFRFHGTPAGFYGLYYKLPQDERYTAPNWLKLTTLVVGDDDCDLGELHMSTGRIAVHLNSDAAFKDMDVYVQAGTGLWGAKIGRAKAPEGEGKPYLITGVPCGIYRIVVMRPDFVQFTKTVLVESTEADIEVAMHIPACTASVSGRLTADRDEAVFLLSNDHSVRAYVPQKDDGTYAVENLPAGDYRIGGYYTVATSKASHFALADGQSAALDVVSDFTSLNKGHLHMQVVDEHYLTVAADVWLQGPAGRIEPYKVDSDGWFFAAEPGRYVLVVSCPGRSMVQVTIHLDGKDLMAGSAGEATVIVRMD
ncbi:MAG: sigma-70 family RNA polymerase sigma factor [Phycisphaerae bacterium]|nr:sigma-70 family RNA polymerase sigma factor [Phycisphaerae bacterium]